MHVNDLATHPNRQKLEKILRTRGAKRDNGCIEWLGTKDPAGYGQIGVDYHTFKIHRVAWVLANGPIPASGSARSLSICHTCDNRGCINTEHMFIGTDADNSDDKVRKNRQQKGESHPASKVTDEQVIAIRLDNRPVAVVAKEYGLSKASVYSIQRNDTWAHVGVAVVNQRRRLRDTPGYVNPLKKPPREKPPKKNRRYTDEDVIAIRASLEPQKVLAERYGITAGIVHAIQAGKVAKDVPMPEAYVPRKRGRPAGRSNRTITKVKGLQLSARTALANAARMPGGFYITDEQFDKLHAYINR